MELKIYTSMVKMLKYFKRKTFDRSFLHLYKLQGKTGRGPFYPSPIPPFPPSWIWLSRINNKIKPTTEEPQFRNENENWHRHCLKDDDSEFQEYHLCYVKWLLTLAFFLVGKLTLCVEAVILKVRWSYLDMKILWFIRFHLENSIMQISHHNTFHFEKYGHFRYAKCLFTNIQKQ